MQDFDLRRVLGYTRNRTLTFSEFTDTFIEQPHDFLKTSSSLLTDAIKHFGFSIVVRHGEPMISYSIFEDIFNRGTNGVFGQHAAIKHLVDAIDAAAREAGPNRGLILVGPPASGKTNMIDLITEALEEYTKSQEVKLYSFFFQFTDEEKQRCLEVWSSFRHNPLLLFPTVLRQGDTSVRPRQELFEVVRHRGDVTIPTFFDNACLDKCSLDILEGLLQNPRNQGKTLFDILQTYVRVEEIVFSCAQAQGISNIDDMRQLRVAQKVLRFSPADKALLDEHLPGRDMIQYQGAMVRANRGILHIHDGFTENPNPSGEYKPLLMLLGSGKASIDATQASVDTTVVMTTNLEEMEDLEKQLTSAKLMDRIEKIPVNYLLDTHAEMDILRRDLSLMQKDYDVDPNLIKIAAYYAVATRLMPPDRERFPENWSERKCEFYNSLPVEKKLFIYACLAEDPLATIRKIPHWHPFRNEAHKLGLDLDKPESLASLIEQHPLAEPLVSSGLFNAEQLSHIDDELMRELWREHHPLEGRHGISVRQLQNIMRNTVANSDGRKVHVGTFLSQLKRMVREGGSLHHWMRSQDVAFYERAMIPSRKIGKYRIAAGEGDYGDFEGLVQVAKYLYYTVIEREITQATVDREPAEIELDLRRYLQNVLLANALSNRAFAHIMVPKFTYVHPTTGEKVDRPDEHFMASLEKVMASDREPQYFRKEIAKKFLEAQSFGDLSLAEHQSVLSSTQDGVLLIFQNLYQKLLSHRRAVEHINGEQLTESFFHLKNKPDLVSGLPEEVLEMRETILNNMVTRFHYPPSIALDTVCFALRKQIVNFNQMIT